MKLIPNTPFIKSLKEIAIPIILQNIIFSGLNLVDTLMIGQLGESSIAAISLANQLYFVLMLFPTAINTGASIFIAQYWGAKNLNHIKEFFDLSLIFNMIFILFFSILIFFFPESILGIFSTDKNVILYGSRYLRIISFSYIFTAVSYSFTIALRSIEKVKMPLYVFTVSLIINIILNFILIFGHLGFPRLGVMGAAIGTLSARIIECTTLVFLVYYFKTPFSLTVKEILAFPVRHLKKYMKTTVPIIINTMGWTLGTTMYNFIYSRMGTNFYSAFAIVDTLYKLLTVLFIGTSSACAVTVGKTIGSQDNKQVFSIAKKYLLLSFFISIFISCTLLVCINMYLSLYKVTGEVIVIARNLFIITAIIVLSKALNVHLIGGIFRGAGDTKYAMLLDTLSIWLIGIPLGLFTAFILKLEFHWVYLIITLEEIVKNILGMKRFYTKKWIHNLVK
jgi:putative MATE family efflux protein